VRLYIACPRAQTGRARRFADLARAAGIRVVSRWHETTEQDAPEPAFSAARAVLAENMTDLYAATHLVALLSDEHGRETYVELGRALERGRCHVVMVPGSKPPLSWADPNVSVAATDERALFLLVSLTRAR